MRGGAFHRRMPMERWAPLKTVEAGIVMVFIKIPDVIRITITWAITDICEAGGIFQSGNGGT